MGYQAHRIGVTLVIIFGQYTFQMNTVKFKDCRWFKSKDLLSKERLSLRNVCQQNDVIKKRVNKGSAMVVLRKQNYIYKGATHKLKNIYYQELSVDPTTQYMMKIKHSLFL